MMTSTTDIGKLYSFMDENPNSYKEIAANDQLKIAGRNWPLIRKMASPPVDIPDVLAGEKLAERVQLKLANRQTKTAHPTERAAVVISEKTYEATQLETGDSSVEVASSLTDDALNIVKITKASFRDPVKGHVVDRPASQVPTLTSLFSRLESDPRAKSLSPVFLKLRQS